MPGLGLVMLLMVGLGIVFTGLPAAVVLIGVAVAGAAVSLVTGTVSLPILTALPGRLVNLFENDLMQALPLYVLMGLLLDRLPVADALYRTTRSEEHTSELQSHHDLVCRLLLEKKK